MCATKETRHVEECLMDSSSRQRASTQRAICEEVFGKKHSSDGTSTVLSGPSTVRFFPLAENQICPQRNQVFESVDAVKAKATQLLNSITQDDLQH